MSSCPHCERRSAYMAHDPEMYRGDDRRCELHQALARLDTQASLCEMRIRAERNLQTYWTARLRRMQIGNVALAAVVACAAWAVFGAEVAVVATGVMAIFGCVFLAIYVERRADTESRALDSRSHTR